MDLAVGRVRDAWGRSLVVVMALAVSGEGAALDFSGLQVTYEESFAGESGSSTTSPEIDVRSLGGMDEFFQGNGPDQLPNLDGTVAQLSSSAAAGAESSQESSLSLAVVPSLETPSITLRGDFESLAFAQGGALMTAQAGVAVRLGSNFVAATIARVANGGPGSPFLLLVVIEKDAGGVENTDFIDLTGAALGTDLLAGDAFQLDLQVATALGTAVASVSANGNTLATAPLSLAFVGATDAVDAVGPFASTTNGQGDDDSVSVEALGFAVFEPPLPLGVVPVLGQQKISATSGGFTGVLEASDRFGLSTTSLGDLDGDGVGDVAVGAFRDDDGGIDRGAVWVLFLNADGSVKGHQKISDTEGGFTGTLDDEDLFGRSVAAIGDVDNDGVVDLAVGAHLDDDGGTDQGAVWVLLLNADGTVRSTVKISDTAGGFGGVLPDQTRFGSSVASGGDIDGDGVPDLIVGAEWDNTTSLVFPQRTGAAWLVLLNADGTVKSEVKLIGENVSPFGPLLDPDDRVGGGVAVIGDVDGDGWTDVAVGAQHDDANGTDRGAVWILFLDANGAPTRTARRIVSGDLGLDLEDGDEFGVDVEAIGDVNLDGVPDLAVGALEDDDGGAEQGAVYIVLLSPGGGPIGVEKISATRGGFTGALDPDDRFGSGIAWLGDADGDGLEELAVTAQLDDDGAVDAGALWLLELDLATCGNGVVEVLETCDDGNTLAQDGCSELCRVQGVVELFGEALGGTAQVEVEGAPFATTTFAGESPRDVAARLATAINAPTAPVADNVRASTDGGRLVVEGVLPGPVTISDAGLSDAPLAGPPGTVYRWGRISSTAGGFDGDIDNGDGFGRSVARLGDLDGDGIDDAVVGATSDDDGAPDTGAIWILFLNADGTVREQQKISAREGGFSDFVVGPTPGGQFGSALASPDASTLLAVGAQEDSTGGAVAGAVWTFQPTPEGLVLSASLGAPSANGDTRRFGRSLAYGPAFPGLLLAGAELFGPGDRGALGTCFSDCGSFTSFFFSPLLDPNDRFGVSVAFLGDLDRNGLEDFAVGAVLDDDGGSDRGAVYILERNSALAWAVKAKISATSGGFTGPLADGDLFGIALAPLGDVDGNGIPDLAVGSLRNGGGTVDSGAVWILFLNADGTVAGEQKIDADLGGFSGALAADDRFGVGLADFGLQPDGHRLLAVTSDLADEGGADRGALWWLSLNSAECGDGAVQFQEQCDDGNTLDGDGCSARCRDQTLFTLYGAAQGGGVSVDIAGEMVNVATNPGDGPGVISASLAAAIEAHPVLSSLGVSARSRYGELIVSGATATPTLSDPGLSPFPVDGPLSEARSASRISAARVALEEIGDVDFFGTSLAAMGDLDASGRHWLAVGATGDLVSSTVSGSIRLLAIEPSGGVSDALRLDPDGVPNTTLSWVGVAPIARVPDVDGDGVEDIISLGQDAARWSLGPGPVLTRLSSIGYLAQPSAFEPIHDVDGNGITDLVSHSSSVFRVGFMDASGDLTAGPPLQAAGPLSSIGVSSIGDVDGDGRDELGLAGDVGGGFELQVAELTPNGNRLIRSRIPIGASLGFLPRLTGVGDVDGDLVPDVVVGRGASEFYLVRLRGDLVAKAIEPLQFAGGPLGFNVESLEFIGPDAEGRPRIALGDGSDDEGGIDSGAVWIVTLNAAVCGNGVVEFDEVCEDGNGDPYDGCSNRCVESGVSDLGGVAEGGAYAWVDLDGVRVSVETLAGQSAADVVAALAAELALNPAAQQRFFRAEADGERLLVDGAVPRIRTNDGGLVLAQLPTTSRWGLVALAFALAGIAWVAAREGDDAGHSIARDGGLMAQTRFSPEMKERAARKAFEQ